MTAPNTRGQWYRDRWRNALIADKRLPLSTRCVAFVLKEYAARGTTVAIALSQLQHETNGARTTVHRAVQQLRELGWLVDVEPSAGRRPAVYELAIPEPFQEVGSGSGALPRDPLATPASGSAATPQPDPVAVAFEPVAVAFDPPSGSAATPIQEIKRSNPPTPRAQVADLLALDEEDELLEHVDDWLSAAGARVPARFIAKAHERGDLLHQLQAHAARTTPAGPPLRTIRTDPDEPTGPRADPQRIRALIDQALSKSHT